MRVYVYNLTCPLSLTFAWEKCNQYFINLRSEKKKPHAIELRLKETKSFLTHFESSPLNGTIKEALRGKKTSHRSVFRCTISVHLP